MSCFLRWKNCHSVSFAEAKTVAVRQGSVLLPYFIPNYQHAKILHSPIANWVTFGKRSVQ